MSPTYTMSAHLCKQIAASWKEMRHPLESGQTSPTGNAHFNNGSYFQRASSPSGSDNGKSSMDNRRSRIDVLSSDLTEDLTFDGTFMPQHRFSRRAFQDS
ncbi:hypothetical protein VP1G_04030 [Cytospora mali]|uniref:Uncharacterized protein n=1 Tax=Cytospora mali TaxID=578113 RepID=A0A194UYI9_CYTMA|nr:hypothetical protein VP1G_04030 [Valsa mali var. pyri (nom. inval.)]